MKNKETYKLIKRSERHLQSGRFNVIATVRKKKGREFIKDFMNKHGIKDSLYYPNILLERDGIIYLVIFSEKTKFPFSKTKGKSVSGIDWFKYKLAEYIEAKTGFQVGIIMYSKEEDSFIFRQMNQLPKPTYWFRDYCLLTEIKKQDPTVPLLNCIKCIKIFPDIAQQCIKNKKGKVMAIWEVDQFQTDRLTIQPQLFEKKIEIKKY